MKEKVEVPVVDYLPYKERIVNTQYREALMRIKNDGKRLSSMAFHEGGIKIFAGNQMRFDMRQGFPVITERKITPKMFHGAIGEVIGFLHGAHTLEELENYGCPRNWWERWTTKERCAIFNLPEGNLGTASYGKVWTEFPDRNGNAVNQWKNVIQNIQTHPTSFTHCIGNWYPPEIIVPGKRKVMVAPCHGDLQIMIFPDTRELILHHKQRSGDVPVGVVFNMIEYASIGMMLAKVLGYTFVEYIHEMVNSHVYDMQWESVQKLFSREARKLPTVTLDFECVSDDPFENFMAIRTEHFKINDDYEPHKFMTIPTPL